MATHVTTPTVIDALKYLAGQCDGAVTEDGVGFNGADAYAGRWYATHPSKVIGREAVKAHQLLRKYRAQLARGGIDYDAIPVPDPCDGAMVARVSTQCADCGGRIRANELFCWGHGQGERVHPVCPGPGDVPAPSDLVQQHSVVRPVAIRASSRLTIGAERIDFRAVFGPSGVVACRLDGYEHREPQLAAGALVERALEEETHATIEAGTGTGKSFVGLGAPVLFLKQLPEPVDKDEAAPARRVLFATATKQLQDQVRFKDAPFLADVFSDSAFAGIFPNGLKVAIVKGRGNYACRREIARLEEGLGGELTLPSAEAAATWPKVYEWLARTETGDLDELDVALPNDLRTEITVDADSCIGRKCRFYNDCFTERAKARAKEADVVVANLALLLTDLSLQAATDGHVTVLPGAFGAVVMDEVHHLEEVATNAFGAEVTPARFGRIAKRIAKLTTDHKGAHADPARQERAEEWAVLVESAGQGLREVTDAVAARLRDARLSVQALGDERSMFDPVFALLAHLARRMDDATPVWLDDEERDQWPKVAKQVAKLAAELSTCADPSNSAYIRYAELDTHGRLTLHCKPIEVAEPLREHLFDNPSFRSVICMSATLATDGGFGRWHKRVGCDQSLELIVDSPFDYPRNALLYVPRDAEAFDSSAARGEGAVAYYDRLADETEQLLLASDGRAFCLFTSFRAMNEVYDRLVSRLRWTVLKQGDLPRGELVRRFKEDVHSVLFATKTFWEGVDIAGEALSLVIIDKIPFAPPDDPVWEAKRRVLTERAVAAGLPYSRAQWVWWDELAIPAATIALKQAAGRLVRTRTDRGVIAILDGRLSTKRYGPAILRWLPPATRTSSRDAVRTFFGQGH